MAALSPQLTVPAGLVPTTTAAGGSGDTIPADSKTVLMVTNGSGSSITVTVSSQYTTQPGSVKQDITKAVAAAATCFLGPFGAAFADTNGNAAITYSATGSVTVAALRTSS